MSTSRKQTDAERAKFLAGVERVGALLQQSRPQSKESIPCKPEIKAPIALTEGDAAIAEIARIKSGKGGKPYITILTVSAAQSESRMDHILKVATQPKEKSMSHQNKPEPDPVVIAEKARDYMAQQHAKGNKFFTITQAVAHVRKDMGLSNDHISGDATLTARSIAQAD
jgi:hypothetical protein